MRFPCGVVTAIALGPLYFATTVLGGGVKEIWWNITYVNNVNPDGLFERRVIGVNNTWPPPPIEVFSTDKLVLHVTNSIDQPTSLHHHGMFFNRSSWMDGARQVSQCGIPPGGNFTYVVPIDEDGQWGTYWIHAHSAGQYVDGLRAPLIIHPPKEVHKYDEEFTVIISDWYHDEHEVLIKQFISPSNAGGLSPIPDSALIYFVQNGAYLPPKAGTTSSHSVTSAVGFNENATLPLQPGKTYRFRVINTGAFSSLFFWVDGHELRIIEGDGTDVEETPLAGQVLRLGVAQRYSFLVTARNDTSSNWGIHLNIDTQQFGQAGSPSANPNVTATISYNTSAPRTDLTINGFQDIDDTALVPIPAIAPPAATRTICLELTFDVMTDGTRRGIFNGVPFQFPLVPSVFSMLTLGENATQASAYSPLTYVLNYGEVVDLVVKSNGGHPFHLHGHKFWIVNRAQNYTSSDPTLNPPIVEGQKNPMRRDTIMIGRLQSATLRFIADNPGAWLFHCHIEWHFEIGFTVQFIEAPLEAQKYSDNFPPILNTHCAQLGLPYSGNAAGHSSTTDLSGLSLGPFPQQPIVNSPCAPVYNRTL